jgi:hypothetical protein
VPASIRAILKAILCDLESVVNSESKPILTLIAESKTNTANTNVLLAEEWVFVGERACIVEKKPKRSILNVGESREYGWVKSRSAKFESSYDSVVASHDSLLKSTNRIITTSSDRLARK